MSDYFENAENQAESKFTELYFQRNNATEDKKRSKLEDMNENNISNTEGDELQRKIIQFSVKMTGRDKESQLKGAQGIRHVLCSEKVPPIADCIKIGIIPLCIKVLEKTGRNELKYEAAWILTNISAGTSEQTDKVVEMGAIEPLLELLSSNDLNLVTQSCWALTNCMGNDIRTRDHLFNREIISLLAGIIRQYDSKQNLMRVVSWCISTAFRGKRTPVYDSNILKAIPLIELLTEMKDIETLGLYVELPGMGFIEMLFIGHSDLIVCAYWALSSVIFIGDSDSETDASLLDNIYDDIESKNILPQIIENLKSDNLHLVYPCLRAIGNLVSGPDAQTEKILAMGALKPLCDCLRKEKTNIVKEAAWVLSNISAGTSEHITAVVKSGAIPLLLNVIYKSEFRAKKEAIWAIANITNGGHDDDVVTLYRSGAIKCLCYALTVADWNTVLVVFEALENMLNRASNINNSVLVRFRSQLEDYGGFDKIFDLQHHENQSVHHKAFAFIRQFY